jgi:hypothetical protein
VCTRDMTTPPRHWRSYGDDPLPTGTEALDEPFRAFPSWFMRITCERCGQERMFNQTQPAGAEDRAAGGVRDRARATG